MPSPIPVPIRRQIVENHQAGRSLKQIAQDLVMSYESVRNVWRLYRKEGRIEPNYANCGQDIQASPRVYRAALFLKRLHPTWGAALIRQIISDKWSEEKVPSSRSLQRWFQEAQINRPKKKRLSAARTARGKVVHQVWAMDSREGIELGTGEKVVWLLLSDEASGAILEGQIFPPRQCFPTER